MPHEEPSFAARLVVDTPGVSPRRIALDRPALTIGRRAYNDLALDDLTVSGEHAIVRTRGDRSIIHDLDSRNGTLVNGERIRRRLLRDGDRIDVGIYRLGYVIEPTTRATRSARAGGMADRRSVAERRGTTDRRGAMRTVRLEPGAPRSAPDPAFDPATRVGAAASLRVLSGARLGSRIALSRTINRIDGSDAHVVIVAHRRAGWAVTHLEGPGMLLVNGAPVGVGAHLLVDGDLVEMAGALLQFRLDR